MNNQNSILLIDPKFDPSTSVNCSLLVKLGIDSFSYAILNKELSKVVAVFDEQELVDAAKKLNDRIKTDVYLGLTFKEVKIAAYTENHIAIPNEFYKHVSVNLNTNFFPEAQSGKVHTTTHSNFGFTSVFSFSSLTEELMSQSFEHSKKYQQSAALLKLAESSTDTAILIDFTVRSMNILVIIEKKVVFQKCYEIENVEEFNYYLLLIANQLSINLNNTSVYVSGIIGQEDKKYECLRKYCTTIHFLDFVDSNLDQQVLDDMPAHYYTTLLALDQCV